VICPIPPSRRSELGCNDIVHSSCGAEYGSEGSLANISAVSVGNTAALISKFDISAASLCANGYSSCSN